VKVIARNHVASIWAAGLPVLILTTSMLRSLPGGLLCTLITGLTVLVNYAIMGLAGIPLGVGSSMFASIAIGTGVNFPIHVLDRLRVDFRRRDAGPGEIVYQAFAFTGRALFFDAMVVGVGFLLLCISEFRELFDFGLRIGTAMLVSFLTSITLLPAILAAWKPRFIRGRQPSPAAK
jgi:uncharacterized protein